MLVISSLKLKKFYLELKSGWHIGTFKILQIETSRPKISNKAQSQMWDLILFFLTKCSTWIFVSIFFWIQNLFLVMMLLKSEVQTKLNNRVIKCCFMSIITSTLVK